jgi:beta-galactosidase
MRPWPSDVVAFGGDYNPEQWSREVWDEDIELMGRAGVTFVSVGIFSWSWLEPKEGSFEFGWLDDIMGRLAAADIAVDLATGTASPPAWFAAAHPEALPVDHEGHRLWPGSRQAWCPSSQVFTDYATRLAREMATRYGDHPALAMWHVSNEYGCHNTPCFCDRCAAGFQDWLVRRYGELDVLNEAWGTAFWSQRYLNWEHILPPRLTPTFHNPGQLLDYHRFQSDALLGQFRAERDVLHSVSPGVPVTTNFMTLTSFRLLDYHRWAPEQDVVSTDHYVVAAHENPAAELSFSADLTRGLADGRPWILMEHSTSAVNWQPVNVAKQPGEMIRNSVAHVARGADTLGFFQWRASRAGSEKYHSALVPHAGPNTAVFDEACRLGALAARLGELVGSTVEADVALLWDYEAAWVVSGPGVPSMRVDYPELALQLHGALWARGVTVDVVHPSADLQPYRLLIVPTLQLVRDENAESIAAAARAGAQVLVTYLSGIVDEDDHVRLGGYPGAFRDLLGVRVEQFRPLLEGQSRPLEGGGEALLWSEDLDVTSATALESYADNGRPARTRNDVGTGSAWYLSYRPDPAGVAALMDELLTAAGVRAPVVAAEGVELVRRRRGGQSWLFAINHTPDAQQLSVSGHDLMSGQPVNGGLSLASGAVAVVREQ